MYNNQLFMFIGTIDTEITITGTGFSATAADMMVTIDGSDCVVSASTSTQVTCTVGDVTVGTSWNHMQIGFSSSNQNFS